MRKDAVRLPTCCMLKRAKIRLLKARKKGVWLKLGTEIAKEPAWFKEIPGWKAKIAAKIALAGPAQRGLPRKSERGVDTEGAAAENQNQGKPAEIKISGTSLVETTGGN